MTGSGSPLQTSFTFSYMRRGKNTPAASNSNNSNKEETATTTTTPAAAPAAPAAAATTDAAHPYENSIKTIATVHTVEAFWNVYDFIKRPGDLPTTTDYHFFRSGIKPTWEDPSNAHGGKWIVRVPKLLASRYWEEIILALIGGQLNVPDGEICGAVLSVRYSEDILGVWNKSATDRELIDKIRDAVKKILQLPSHANMEYKPHQTSMQDRSSFRNTHVWKPTSNNAKESTTTRRSGSWGEQPERSKPAGGGTKGRDMARSWRS